MFSSPLISSSVRKKIDTEQESLNQPVGQVVMHSFVEQRGQGSNLGLLKSNTVLPTARHRCNISLKEAVLPTGAITRRWAPQTRFKHRHDTASIIKDLT